MSKKLWYVKYTVMHSKSIEERTRYAIGETEEAAIEQAKQFAPRHAEAGNFSATEVDTGTGEYYLWEVEYCEPKSDCSGVEWARPMLVPGRNEDEAIRRTQATQSNDATDFSARRIDEFQGFAIRLINVQGHATLLEAASTMSGE